MRNPFLKNYSNVNYYVLAWMLFSAVQAGIMVFHHGLSQVQGLTDALVSNSMFSLLALVFWHPVRYIGLDRQRLHAILLNHLAVALVFLTAWSGLMYLLLPVLLGKDVLYIAFFTHTFFIRILTGFLMYGLVVLVYYLYLYYYSFNEKLNRESALYRSFKDSELQLLKSQLHPHFIFNSLNSVSALLIADPGGAQEMLLKLSSFLRKSLDKNETALVSFEEELAFAMLYLDIEKIRFGDRLMVCQAIAPESLRTQLPHLLLQPLLENAVKHGVGESLDAVIISITARREENDLHLCISNNHDPNVQTRKGKGIGLKNVQQRLALMYGRKDCIHLRNEQNTFEVNLYIPQS